MSDVRPQVGEYWRTGEGKVVGPLEDSNSNSYPLHDRTTGWTFTIDGKFDRNLLSVHPRDLLDRVHILTDAEHAEWEAGKATPAKLDKLTEESPRDWYLCKPHFQEDGYAKSDWVPRLWNGVRLYASDNIESGTGELPSKYSSFQRLALVNDANKSTAGEVAALKQTVAKLQKQIDDLTNELADTRSAAGNDFPADWSLPRIMATLRQKVNERVLRPALVEERKRELEAWMASNCTRFHPATFAAKAAEVFVGVPSEENPISPTLQRQFRRAAHDIGDLFTWSVQNLSKFPPPPGKEWLDEIKERLLAGANSPAPPVPEVIEGKGQEKRLQFLEQVCRNVLTELYDNYDGAPDSGVLWMGWPIQQLESAVGGSWHAPVLTGPCSLPEGVWVVESSSGREVKAHMVTTHVSLEGGARAIRVSSVPSFPRRPPPRPTFTAPPKPELVLVRCQIKSGNKVFWATRVTDGYIECGSDYVWGPRDVELLTDEGEVIGV